MVKIEATPIAKALWKEAKEKMRNYIRWCKILGARKDLFHTRNLVYSSQGDCYLDGETCRGDFLCRHTSKCCIFCDLPECSYSVHFCGCIKARDAILNLWFHEEEVINSDKQPWEV